MRLTGVLGGLRKVLIPCVLILVACCGLVFSWSGVAHASNEAGAVVKERAEREFDSKAGAGTANQLEGQAKEQVGRAQRQLGDDAEGAATQAKGNLQKNFGKAQEAAEDTKENADGLVDKVKDFFD